MLLLEPIDQVRLCADGPAGPRLRFLHALDDVRRRASLVGQVDHGHLTLGMDDDADLRITLAPSGDVLRLEALDIPAPAHPAFVGLGCTLTPGTLIRGGEFESIVPAQAEAMVDVRLMPGQSAKDVLERVDRVRQRSADTVAVRAQVPEGAAT